ncbi:MAG TPA: thymidine phosphorylase [Deltaproteobacteria bacterium]|nr:thymidine phosphorylase [Deltaproteobacteria bacterium]
MSLILRRVGIDTYHENIAYLPAGSELAKSQGFNALSKVEVHSGTRSILATLNMTENGLVKQGEIGLSNIAFQRLGVDEGSPIRLSHPNPLLSFEFVRQKLEGRFIEKSAFLSIMRDIVGHRYSNIELTAFVIAGYKQDFSVEEIIALTEAMIETGERIDWGLPLVLDKHCVGGIPGNRSTMIVVPIIAALGLPMPKTSSRAITSPSGTADTMETLSEVRLSLEEMREVVAAEHACIAWGGSVALAPADDILISVERPLNLDSEGQMIASILAKKRAAGSNRMVLDIPIGPTAKVESSEQAERLKRLFQEVGRRIGLQIHPVFSEGLQPCGRGIGPALEARDVLQVLQGLPGHPEDLREKSLFLAGELLEFSGHVTSGRGLGLARETLESGQAWEKFQRIAWRQGGLREPRIAKHSAPVTSSISGVVEAIHNQKIASSAKLAGAPHDPGAGVFLEAKVGDRVEAGAPLFRIYAENPEELRFSLDYVAANEDIFRIRSARDVESKKS